jgi:hypothetical protein
MVRLVLALALAATPAADGISAYEGGHVRSPDGRWTVSAAAVDPNGPPERALARLDGPGVRGRRLLAFDRQVDVIWPGGDRVLLVQRTLHFASIHAFTLAPGERGVDRIQADIGRAMARNPVRLRTVENRLVAFGRECVLVEESGLPRSRREGGFVARRASFRLDLAKRRALPIADCPGARIG